MKQQIYPNLTSLKLGMHTNEIKYLDGDLSLPYVLGLDNQWYYFSKFDNGARMDGYFVGSCFSLIMVSFKDLGVQPA